MTHLVDQKRKHPGLSQILAIGKYCCTTAVPHRFTSWGLAMGRYSEYAGGTVVQGVDQVIL
jgi:hypothetical protein